MDCNNHREDSILNRPQPAKEPKTNSVAAEIANHLESFTIQEASQIICDVKEIIIHRLEINLKDAHERVNIADDELNYFKQKA